MTVIVSTEVLTQIKELAATGRTNMFDYKTVLRMLEDMGLFEAYHWARDNKGLYLRVLIEGPTEDPEP